MPRKPNLADKFMAEVISLGGFELTRADAYAWLKHDGHDARTCDLFAFGPNAKAIDADPTLLADVLAIIAECEAPVAVAA